MTPSKKPARPREAFVWTWLPETTQPVVAGKLTADGNRLLFNYGRSYLDRGNAISLYEPELPLRAGILPLPSGLSMPGCLRDAAPDAWGRRVLINKLLRVRGARVDTTQLDELTYLLESGSDRTGALDFQRSATEYVPREKTSATLAELLESADRVEKGVPLTKALGEALQHGSSIGGARPKALIAHGPTQYVAKFSSSTDVYSMVKAEFIAMRLARHVGLNVASVELKRAGKKDVLLVQRFDRIAIASGWQRRAMVSALTMLGLDEMMARYASYEDLAEIIRHRFTDAPAMLRELFSRLVFNVLCGNTDDHARNHAAFWDGRTLALTPAYDICPQPRTGNEASQAMLIAGEDRMSRISSCLAAAHHFQLSRREAESIAARQVATIAKHWDDVCEEAKVTRTDRRLLATRQFLNPYSVEGLDVEGMRPT
jgi:serine/threonine-protein kinase HipA